MTAEVGLWMASSGGAALFFLAGWLAQQLRKVPPVEIPVVDAAAIESRTLELQLQRAELTAALRETQAREDEAQRLAAAAAERVRYLEIRLSQVQTGEAERTLRHDLALQSERLRGHEQRARFLEEENARLRNAAIELPIVQKDLARARAELSDLRARQFAARTPVRPGRLTVLGEGPQRGQVLQALVERVSGLADVRGAVVADELGLVVAAHGELGEELAAVGALFTRAASLAQRELPLGAVHRVIVEDSNDLVMTFRPIYDEDGGDGALALITLGVGHPPDPRQVTRLLHTAPRAALGS